MAKLIEITGKALAGEWGTDDETGKGIPVLRTTNFTNEGVVDYNDVVTRTITKKNIDEKFLRPGDIIIEKSGGSDKYPVGRVIYFDGPSSTYLFNNFTGLLRVQDQKKWFPKYVFYSLYGNYRRGGTRQFENKTTGLHNLKTDDYVTRYDIVEADYSKQKEVCSLLDKLYSIVKMREEELVKLDELIKARFVELFGNILSDRNLPLVQLSEIVDIGSSKRIYANEYVEEGIPFYRSKEIRELGSGLKPSVELFIKPERYDEIKDKYGVPKVGDILIAAIGATIGYSWIVNTENPFYYKDGNLIILSIKDDVNPVFLNHTMGILIEDFKNKGAAGSAQLALTIEKLEKMMVINPDIRLQNQFADFVKQIDKSKVVVQKALNKARLLFDSLMQNYFG